MNRHYVHRCQRYPALVAAHKVGARIPFRTTQGLVLDCSDTVYEQWQETYKRLRKNWYFSQKDGKEEKHA